MANSYKGWNFKKWCSLNPDDERKINYLLKGIWDGRQQKAQFTSEDTVDMLMFFRIQEAIIEKVELVNNEWFVVLVY